MFTTLAMLEKSAPMNSANGILIWKKSKHLIKQVEQYAVITMIYSYDILLAKIFPLNREGSQAFSPTCCLYKIKSIKQKSLNKLKHYRQNTHPSSFLNESGLFCMSFQRSQLKGIKTSFKIVNAKTVNTIYIFSPVMLYRAWKMKTFSHEH